MFNFRPGLDDVSIRIALVADLYGEGIDLVLQADLGYRRRSLLFALHLSNGELGTHVTIGMAYGEGCFVGTIHTISRIGLPLGPFSRFNVFQVTIRQFSAIIEMLQGASLRG